MIKIIVTHGLMPCSLWLLTYVLDRQQWDVNMHALSCFLWSCNKMVSQLETAVQQKSHSCHENHIPFCCSFTAFFTPSGHRDALSIGMLWTDIPAGFVPGLHRRCDCLECPCAQTWWRMQWWSNRTVHKTHCGGFRWMLDLACGPGFGDVTHQVSQWLSLGFSNTFSLP